MAESSGETERPSRAGDPPSKLDRTFLFTFAVLCGLALVPLWLVTCPPLVDLPQHAAQVATWLRWDDAGFGYKSYLWNNWQSPYQVTQGLAYLLSSFLPVAVSFQVILSLYLLALPLATLAWIRQHGGNPWWAILVIPVGYGYAFFMGFVAFALAVPLAFLVVLLAGRQASEPDHRRGLGILLLLQLLFVTHPLVFGWAGLTAALLVAVAAPDLRSALRRWTPLLAALVLPVVWLLLTLQSETTAQGAAEGAYAWSRPLEIPSFLLGQPLGVGSLALGSLFLAVPFLTGGHPSRKLGRWIPFLVSVGLFLAAPYRLFGTAFLYRRFSLMILPTLLFALDWRPAQTYARLRRTVLVGLVATWIGFLAVQLWGYEAEMGSFQTVVDAMEPNRRVLYLPLDRFSEFVPYPVFLHFGTWYQVEKGGIVDFSFAEYFLNRFRYREGEESSLPDSFEWKPWVFDWELHDGERYEYFLVRSPRDPTGWIRQTGAKVRPEIRARGGWWLYRRDPEAVGD